MTTTAFYAGSFDPITNGHLDILRQSLAVFDYVVVAIGVHPGKTPMFSFEQREQLLNEVLTEAELPAEKVKVLAFDKLVVEAAKDADASVLVRGVRDGSDLDYEMQLAGMNGAMAPDLKTIFLPSSPSVRPITATLVRQIAKMGGDVSSFVPRCVERALNEL